MSPRERFRRWKPIPLCWLYRRMGWRIPRYLIGHGTFDVSQVHYRFYNDDGSEAASTPIAAEDTAVSLAAQYGATSAIVHLRITLDEISGLLDGATTDAWWLQVSQNGGAYQNISAASTLARGVATANLTNAGATTNRATNGLTDPAGAFDPGEQCTDGLIDSMQILLSNFTEVVYSLQLQGSDLANADTLDFQVRLNSANLVSYAVTPRINVTQTNPTISSGSMADADRDWTTPYQDIAVTFSRAVAITPTPTVGDTVAGLTASVNGGAGQALTYRSGSGTASWKVRLAQLVKNGDAVTISYAMASGVILATDDSAEVRETTGAATTNNLTKRIRANLKNDAGAAITTAVDMAVCDAEPRDSDDAAWFTTLQRHPNVTPDASGIIDVQATDASLVVGDPVYIAVFNPREDVTTSSTYARTALAIATVT